MYRIRIKIRGMLSLTCLEFFYIGISDLTVDIKP